MLLAERAESERLRQIIKELQRHRFGRRAESLPEEQLQLGLEDIEQVDAASQAESEAIAPVERERCCRGTFRSDVGRVIVGAARGSDTCRFQSISICRSRSGAWKCSRALVGGEAGPRRIRRRALPRVTARARRSVAWRGAMV